MKGVKTEQSVISIAMENVKSETDHSAEPLRTSMTNLMNLSGTCHWDERARDRLVHIYHQSLEKGARINCATGSTEVQQNHYRNHQSADWSSES